MDSVKRHCELFGILRLRSLILPFGSTTDNPLGTLDDNGRAPRCRCRLGLSGHWNCYLLSSGRW